MMVLIMETITNHPHGKHHDDVQDPDGSDDGNCHPTHTTGLPQLTLIGKNLKEPECRLFPAPSWSNSDHSLTEIPQAFYNQFRLI